ncbi:transcription initiation factor TFIID subunit 8 [Cichlidogyrus casuarinus]|uniref:Transcription initiation factor TFIID subunit 8 n=1 Tax=Cichlidogyrus casuarinus TaxID=1844966 RepID=A0ABD2PX58_9PLAT
MSVNRVWASYGVPQGIVDVLEGAVGFTALFHNFTSIESSALALLNNLLLTFMEDLAIRSLSYAEAANRTKILLSDVVLALIDFGFDLRHLNELPRKRQYKGFKEPLAIEEGKVQGRSKNSIFSTCVLGPTNCVIIPKSPSIRVDSTPQNQTFNAMAPSHLVLPPVPEAHTYLNSRIKRPSPGSDPIALRKKVLDQNRKVQLSLSKFLGRICPVMPLFPNDTEPYSILLPKPLKRPYITAINTDLDARTEEKNSDTNGEPMQKASSEKVQMRENFFFQTPRFPCAD